MFFRNLLKKKTNELEPIKVYGKEDNSYEKMKKRTDRLIRLFNPKI